MLGWGALQRAPAPPFSFLSALQAFPFPKGALPGLDGVDSGSPYLSAVLLSEKNGRQVVFLGVWLFRGRDPGCAEGL